MVRGCRRLRYAISLLVLAVFAAACGGDSGSTAVTSTTNAPTTAAPTTTSTTLFPGSPAPSEEVLEGLAGFHASFLQRPATVGMPAGFITGDAMPYLEAVDVERLAAHVEAVAVPRGPGDDQNLVQVGRYVFEELDATEATVDVEEVAPDLLNLVADVPGTVCPDRGVVVAAHFDGPEGSPGADSNATGVAALLETTRLVADDPLPMTVQFVALPRGVEETDAIEQRLEGLGADALTVVSWINVDGAGVTSTDEDPLLGAEHGYLLMATDETGEYLARVFSVATARFLPNFWAWGAVLPDEYRDDLGVREPAAREAGYMTLTFTDTGQWRDERVGTEDDTPDIIDLDFLANSTRSLLAGLVGLGTLDVDQDGTPDVCTRDVVEE